MSKVVEKVEQTLVVSAAQLGLPMAEMERLAASLLILNGLSAKMSGQKLIIRMQTKSVREMNTLQDKLAVKIAKAIDNYKGSQEGQRLSEDDEMALLTAAIRENLTS